MICPALFALLLLMEPQTVPTTAPFVWQLVWSEEFDYEGLPDPAKWDYEEGFIRNNELQYYTRGRAENARVEGGVLVLEGRREPFPNARPDSRDRASPRARETAEYTSASINTLGKAGWQYGRIEVRAKLPQGRGVWPAAWMMGVNRPQVGWPACGEIDIMEFVGKDPQTVHATVHYRTDKKRSKGEKLEVTEPLDEFHVYAVDWSADRMDFYFDDRRYHSFPVEQATTADGENPFRKPHYLLLNLALGGSWGGAIDDAILPQRYEIDYVRVYQKK